MGLFAGIKGKRATKGGVYFKPGIYEVEINRCQTGKTRGGEDFFVAETRILESTNEELPKGTTCSWMQMFREPDLALGAVADFCRAAMFSKSVQEDEDPGVENFDDIEVDEEDMDLVVGEDQPLAGVIVKVEAANIKTKKGNDFTKVVFKPAD